MLLDPDVTEIEARISWGDYRTEPPLPEDFSFRSRRPTNSARTESRSVSSGRLVDWVRMPKGADRRLPVRDGRGDPIVVPESAAEQRRGGGLTLETHSRLFSYTTPDGKTERVRALTVFLVNRRATVHRFYADVSYAFQARLELGCEQGFRPRRDLSGYHAQDWDLRVADLHYRDICEWAVGRNAAAGWDAAEDRCRASHARLDGSAAVSRGRARRPERRRRAQRRACTFGMETLAELADGGWRCDSAEPWPICRPLWALDRSGASRSSPDLPDRRRETGEQPHRRHGNGKGRIAAGIDILARDAKARTAFRFMNLAVAMAARRRIAGATGDPTALPEPQWRPFQLAFILLNLARPGRSDARRSRDGRPAVLPNRRRQDRGLSRARRLRDRSSAVERLRRSWRRRRRHHALHAAPSDA